SRGPRTSRTPPGMEHPAGLRRILTCFYEPPPWATRTGSPRTNQGVIVASSNLRRAFIAAVFGIALPALAVAQGSPAPAPAAEGTELSAQEEEMQGWYM